MNPSLAPELLVGNGIAGGPDPNNPGSTSNLLSLKFCLDHGFGCSLLGSLDELRRTARGACHRRRHGLRRLARNDKLPISAATNQPDGQITSDFQKSCQDPESKIFRLTRRANQRYWFARLTRREGRCARHDTRGGMRWTRALRRTNARSRGRQGVWFWHRGAGVKFPGSFPGATAASKPFAGKSTL